MFGKIIGTGAYVPERTITNDELSKFVETNNEWITERTGIHMRHIMKDETTADMAADAAQKAMEDAQIEPDEIDMIIVSSVSSNLILPNTACYVQEKIGAINAVCFDLNTACTGFIMAYNTVQSYINAGLIETALIIGAEGLSKLVDWEDRGTCILFGDGAGAAVVRKNENAVFETVMHADGGKGNALTCNQQYAGRKTIFDKEKNKAEKDLKEEFYKAERKNTYIQMDGQEIFRFAIKKVPRCIGELMTKMHITEKDVDLFLLHQANGRILQAVAKKIGTSMDKVPVNITEHGNTSSACIPILLDEIKKEGRIKPGDRVVMSGFGAGLTWAAAYLQF